MAERFIFPNSKKGTEILRDNVTEVFINTKKHARIEPLISSLVLFVNPQALHQL